MLIDTMGSQAATGPVIEALSAMRAPLTTDERELHDLVAGALTLAGVSFRREASIGPRCRVDFLCQGGVAIEVKRGKPGRKALLAQLGRYAACEEVRAIILAVERTAAVPARVNGKPLILFGLNRLWGVAL